MTAGQQQIDQGHALAERLQAEEIANTMRGN